MVRRFASAVGRARIPMTRIAATTNASRIRAIPKVAMLFSIAMPFFFIMTRKLTSPVLAGRSCANRLWRQTIPKRFLVETCFSNIPWNLAARK